MKILLFAVQLVFVSSVFAQDTDYPTHPIQQIVQFPPGGGVDVATRSSMPC